MLSASVRRAATSIVTGPTWVKYVRWGSCPAIVTTRPVLLLEDRYRLDDRIGAGAMGEVWRATDVLLNRPVAVKLLRPELAQREDDLARFRAEARSAASVPHPCVVQVYDYCEDDSCGRPYLVMELVDGTPLDRLLDGGPAGAAFTLDIIAQTARGLAAAHEAGLVHRDIKPQNLLLTRAGQVKITDFGIARAAGSAPLTRTGMMLGTPAYLAPERALGQAGTPAADLYALGIVAYRCLAGRLPFNGEPLAVMLAQQQSPLPPLPPSVPPGVAALVAELTAKDPGARPASAGQVATRARQLRAALVTKPTPPSVLAAHPAGTADESLLAALGGTIRRGDRDRPGQRPHRHRPFALAGRVGLAVASVVAIGLTGWILAHPSGATARRLPPHAPAAITGPPDLRPLPHHRRHRLVDVTRHNATTPPAVTPDQVQAPPATSFTPSRAPAPRPSRHGTPTHSPTPSGTPTPTPTPSGTPTPTPSGTPTPTPSGTPTSSPTSGGTPTASTISGTASTTPAATPAFSVPAG